MSCLIPFMEEQIAQLQTQLKTAAFSHDIKAAEINALNVKVAELEARLNPPAESIPEMKGRAIEKGKTAKTGTDANGGAGGQADPVS